MPVDPKRFKRARPPSEKPPQPTIIQGVSPNISVGVTGDIEAEDPDGNPSKLSTSRLKEGGLLTSDLTTQDLLKEVLYELKHIRLHLEVLSGEDLRGDVDYADQ